MSDVEYTKCCTILSFIFVGAGKVWGSNNATGYTNINQKTLLFFSFSSSILSLSLFSFQCQWMVSNWKIERILIVDTLLCSLRFSHRPSDNNKTAQIEAFFVHAYAAHLQNRVSMQIHSLIWQQEHRTLLVSFILIQYGCSVEICISRRTATKRCFFRIKTKFISRFIQIPMMRDIILIAKQWTVNSCTITVYWIVKRWEFVTFHFNICLFLAN